MEKQTGCVHIYCGDGKGKTTCGMGLCTRAAGYGYRVLIYQFMKDNGLVVTELSDEDREVMKEKIQPVYDYLNAQYDWVDDVRKMVDDIKVE